MSKFDKSIRDLADKITASAKRKQKEIEAKRPSPRDSSHAKVTGGRRSPAQARHQSEVRDTKSDADRRRAGSSDKKGSPQRKAAREIYAAQPVAKRREILRNAKANPTPVGRAVTAEHRARKKYERTDRGKQRRALERIVRAGSSIETAGRSLERIPKQETSGIGGKVLGAIEDELSGKGKLASVLSSLGSTLADHTNPGGGYPTATQGLPLTEKLSRNTVKDVIELPAQVVPSVYLPAKEVVKGNPKGAAEMVAQPFIDAAKDPEKAFTEHPLNTTLMATGVRSAVARPAGKVLRVAGKVPERAPKALPGTTLKEERQYAKGADTMALQIAADKLRERRASKIEKKAEADETLPRADRERRMRKAAQVRGTTMTPADVRRRVDERVSATEEVRRANRGRVVKDVDKIVRRKGAARSVATVLVTQNITRATRADLRAYAKELEAEAPNLGKAGKAANRDLRRRISRALRDPRFHPGEIEVAARKYAEYSRSLQDALVDRGLLAREQVDRAAVIPYAVREMGAKQEDGRLVAADGSELSTAAIRDHMRENNVSDAAFVTQAPNSRGARNFYVASDRDPKAASQRRTGEATRKGTFDGSPETLRETAARAQGLVDAADGFRSFVDEFSVRAKSGKVRAFGSYQQAQRAADELGAATSGAQAYVPVRLNAFGTRKEQTEALLEQTARDPRPLQRAIEEALGETGEGAGPWALVPEAAAARMREHMNTASPLGETAGKLAQVYGSQFRKVVLSTSPKWMVGNIAEAGLRSGVARSGPRSYAQGRRVLKALEEVDPKAARELSARALSGGHYSLGSRATVHRNAESFAGTRLEPLAQSLGKVWRTPGPKHVAQAWNAWTSLVMDSVNGRIEVATQTAMLGKALRDSPLLERRVLKLGNTAVREAAEGLRETSAQVRFAREVDAAYGKYSKWSPGMRGAISAYTPFIAWWLNSVRFVYSTLPKDHPVLTALLASANVASEEWRKEIGQYYGSDLPDYLLGAIPTEGGGWRRVSELTPFSVATSPAGPAAKFPSLVLPQPAGVFAALEGKDWRGVELKTDSGRPYNGVERAAYAGKELIASTVPVFAQALRTKDREGSTLDKVLEELNPIRESKPKGARKASSGGSGSSSDLVVVDGSEGSSVSDLVVVSP